MSRRLMSILALSASAAIALVSVGILLASDSDSDADGTGARESSTAGVRLAKVRGGLGDALYITPAPGNARLFVVTQSGRIQILDRGTLRTQPFLDISGIISSGGERGLLGLAFHPDYARNGRFYVNYTDTSGNTRVVEYRRSSATRANAASARPLLEIRQPFSNHNGGALEFGPDGMLYIATGDGGGGGDPQGNGQSTQSLLGKLLRIDVDARTGGLPYGIPAGNPFAGGGGRAEIYSYGLRNPWRFSFDRTRGDLWIGDVGQGELEEVDYRAKGRGAGANFGWNAFEGRSTFSGGASALRRGSKHVPPVAQYTHAQGCSITGGYVYRGTKVPALAGRYIYADFCSGRVWTMRAGPKPGGVRQETGLGAALSNVTSFGQGAAGEVYVIANGTLYRFAPR